jgi:hypothetical protein
LTGEKGRGDRGGRLRVRLFGCSLKKGEFFKTVACLSNIASPISLRLFYRHPDRDRFSDARRRAIWNFSEDIVFLMTIQEQQHGKEESISTKNAKYSISEKGTGISQRFLESPKATCKNERGDCKKPRSITRGRWR